MRKPEVEMTYRVQLVTHSPAGMLTLESTQVALTQMQAIRQARLLHGVPQDFGQPIVTIFHTGTFPPDNSPLIPNS